MASGWVQSKQEQEILLKKHKRALELRAEFNKKITDPFRHATGEGGTVFDAGLQRFHAMRASQYDHFKPTPKQFRITGFFVVLPIVVFAWMLKKERSGREHKFRTGQVSYRDRKFKFI